MTGRISPARFVQLTSANPARLFGLWPQKGNLAVGADADVVIIDPQKITTIEHTHLHDNADYSPYEGFRCRGEIITTLCRGASVFQAGKFTGQAGYGRFIHRQPFAQPSM